MSTLRAVIALHSHHIPYADDVWHLDQLDQSPLKKKCGVHERLLPFYLWLLSAQSWIALSISSQTKIPTYTSFNLTLRALPYCHRPTPPHLFYSESDVWLGHIVVAGSSYVGHSQALTTRVVTHTATPCRTSAHISLSP